MACLRSVGGNAATVISQCSATTGRSVVIGQQPCRVIMWGWRKKSKEPKVEKVEVEVEIVDNDEDNDDDREKVVGVIIMTPITDVPNASEIMLSDMTEIPSIKFMDVDLRLELEDLSSEHKEIARKELRETPDLMRESLDELRALLKEDTELCVPADKDQFLIRFLRPCKFYPKSAYELIQRYYAFKVKHNNIYDGLKPSKESNIFQQNILTVLPYRDQFGRRILILELGKKWKHNKCSLDEVFKGVVLFLEAAMMEPLSQVAGAVVIFDMDGLSLQQVWQFTPPFAKRIVDWLQESVPLRVKNIHIVNQPYIFNMVFQLFKPFLKDKLRSRIIFHGTDRDSLHKYISPKCLPKCYAGEQQLPVIQGSQWYELLLSCDKEYDAINSYGYNKNNNNEKKK